SGCAADRSARRLAPQSGHEPPLGPPDLGEPAMDVNGNPDRAGLVGQRPGQRLADPPGRVGRELVPLAAVVLLRRPHQPDRALLDEIEEGQTSIAVVLGIADEEPQDGLDHPLPSGATPYLAPL